jgi:WD40 repeat protein
VAFSTDGDVLASSGVRFAGGEKGTVVLWNMPGGRQLGPPLTAGSPGGKNRAFRALAFSPNGTLLVGGGSSGAQLWDVPLHEALGGPLSRTPADAVAVSADGRLVVVGDSHGAVRAYPATVDGWLRSACDVVGRNLSRGEWDSFVTSARPYERTCPQYPPGQ